MYCIQKTAPNELHNGLANSQKSPKSYLYKMQVLFELKETDKATRNDYAMVG